MRYNVYVVYNVFKQTENKLRTRYSVALARPSLVSKAVRAELVYIMFSFLLKIVWFQDPSNGLSDSATSCCPTRSYSRIKPSSDRQKSTLQELSNKLYTRVTLYPYYVRFSIMTMCIYYCDRQCASNTY